MSNKRVKKPCLTSEIGHERDGSGRRNNHKVYYYRYSTYKRNPAELAKIFESPGFYPKLVQQGGRRTAIR